MRTACIAFLLGLATVGMAHAVDSVGWVFNNQPNATKAYTPDSAYSYNSAGGSITIVPVSTGHYTVEYGKLDVGGAVVQQVSAYGTSGYCMAGLLSWTAKDTVDADVFCYDANGNPANSYFTEFVQQRIGNLGSARKGLSFFYGGVVSGTPFEQYNSTGGTNTVLRNGVGNFTATLPGLTGAGGDVQVTADISAYSPTGRTNEMSRCKVGSWSPSPW